MRVIPFMEHCGIHHADSPPGVIRLTATTTPALTNTRGHAHGGLLMTMLDIALGCAARDAVAEAVSFMTVDLHVVFLAAGEGDLVAEGRVLRAGRSLVFCEGEVRDSAAVMLARASGVFKPLFPR